MGAGVGVSSLGDATGISLIDISGTTYDVYYITNAIYALLVAPFMKLAQSPFAVFLILFLVGLF